ncbi:REP-associated tyrosine transposase [Arenimonas alkanexedens]
MPRPNDHPGYQRLRLGRTSEPGRVYFLTTVTHARAPLFKDFVRAAVMSRVIACPTTWAGGRLLAWVLMPDHWHGLLEIDGTSPLTHIVRLAKGRSARHFNLALVRQGSVWRDGFHDRAIRRSDDLRAAARYLIANPLRAGLVKSVGDYPFWDAHWIDASPERPFPD